MNSDKTPDFGQNLAKLIENKRIGLKISRDELAKAINMSRRTYFDKIRQPGEFTVNELRYICKALGFTLSIEPKQEKQGIYFND